MRNARVIALVLIATLSNVGCETPESRQAAEDRSNRRAAEELRQLCTLPAERRKIEIERLQKRYNVTIVCPPQAP
jgi:hypothetical protein